MPSVVDSPLFQPDGDEKVVDYLELLQIPPGTSTPDSQKIISEVEGNIKSTYVQNIQIVGAVSFSSCFLPLSLSIFTFFLFFSIYILTRKFLNFTAQDGGSYYP